MFAKSQLRTIVFYNGYLTKRQGKRRWGQKFLRCDVLRYP